MNKNINKAAQGGFTLIELIVVIVILGILAATALPKFMSVSTEARAASLRAAGGALNSTISMAHGKALVTPTAVVGGKLTVEGAEMTMNADNYPTSTTGLADAAGLNATDWTRTANGGTLTISPVGISSDNIATCSVLFTDSATAGVPPTVAVRATKCD